MEGEDEASDKEDSFSKASIPKRIAIVVAGASINIIFAIVVYFILISTSGTFISNEINEVVDGYVAEEIGLQQGDKIIKINDEEIKSKYDLDNVMDKNNGEEINLKVDRNGEVLDFGVKPTEVKSKITGIYLDEEAKIITMDKNSPAEKAGIENNDVILKINGEDINNSRDKAIEILNKEKQNVGSEDNNIGNDENKEIEFVLKRGNAEVTVKLIPDTISTYYLGVNMKQAEDTFINRCINGAIETNQFVFSIFDNLKQLFTGNVGIDQMMGPVGISEVVAKTNGFREFFEMMALISLSLGVTNLLPIPALDGGKILILLIEAIRRRPLKQETENNLLSKEGIEIRVNRSIQAEGVYGDLKQNYLFTRFRRRGMEEVTSEIMLHLLGYATRKLFRFFETNKKCNFWSAPSNLIPEQFKKPSAKRLAKKGSK